MVMLKYRQEIVEDVVPLIEGYQYEHPETRWILVQAEPGAPSFLEGFFDDEASARDAYHHLGEFAGIELPLFALEVLEDCDWKEAYKFHLKVWTYGSLAWIPIWEKGDVALMATITAKVYLDSGMAFGTGSHETTRLCAQALVDLTQAGEAKPSGRVVDAGCGSGVLALSARALGFQDVRGFDNDPEAVRISRENAKINQSVDSIDFTVDDLETGLTSRCADILLANIETPVLKTFHTELLEAVSPGGTLILSGILVRDGQGVQAVFETGAASLWDGVSHSEVKAMGEWCRVVLQRP